ncbi:hypothetical protein WHR41_01608 [Cladosporium halotolerans]|uniref:BTB domain-containing protein n=1 Tax=Cladosporium halotolerans TaxID=1052096 RepID=A0AB34KZN3_9PEZI
MTETFTVSVGPTEKEFTVHKNIATRSSKYFQAALAKCWKEGCTSRVELSEHDEGCFEGYLQWLYTSEITFASKPDVGFQICRLYILGDYLGDQKFCNAVIDRAISRWINDKVALGLHAFELVWSSTPDDSPLRTLILEMISNLTLTKMVKSLKSHQHCCSKDLMLEYLTQMATSQQLSRSVGLKDNQKRQIGEKLKRSVS